MHTWVLILFFVTATHGSTHVGFTNIQGFKTEKECSEMGRRMQLITFDYVLPEDPNEKNSWTRNGTRYDKKDKNVVTKFRCILK